MARKKKLTLMEVEFNTLYMGLRDEIKERAKKERWRPSELAMTLSGLKDRLLKNVKVVK